MTTASNIKMMNFPKIFHFQFPLFIYLLSDSLLLASQTSREKKKFATELWFYGWCISKFIYTENKWKTFAKLLLSSFGKDSNKNFFGLRHFYFHLNVGSHFQFLWHWIISTSLRRGKTNYGALTSDGTFHQDSNSRFWLKGFNFFY